MLVVLNHNYDKIKYHIKNKLKSVNQIYLLNIITLICFKLLKYNTIRD